MSDRKVHIIIDNIRSAYNVGSIFRTANGAYGKNVEIHICGFSPTPENPKVAKTALSAEKIITWGYFKNSELAIKELKKRKVPVFALEKIDGAEDYRSVSYPSEFAILIGHEVEGVPDELLAKVDKIISIPMRGSKESLNVASAIAIFLYESNRDSRGESGENGAEMV